ncbi:MAG TPA: two-component regulator propeller domain-containing protein [Saprospiraceae bacterium]|nr:two-component regulator propeller domain-containing protein [Saprospiraceae bacterium]
MANYYDFKDGLNNNLVYCLKEDSRGFLWLATKEGINRFDGFQFKKYFNEKNNPNSLSHNKVFDIMEYQPGILLFATGSGLSILNTKTGQFVNDRIKYPPLRAGSGTVVNSFFKDAEERIWISHSGEIDVFDNQLNYLYRFTDRDWAKSLKGNISRYETWYMDQKGRLWFPTDGSGLQIIDFDAQQVYNRNNNPEQLPYLEYSIIRSFLFDERNNTLWLAPWGEGLIKFDLVTGKIFHEYFNVPEPGEDRTINTLLQTSRGNILFTIGGICYDMDPKTMIRTEVPVSKVHPYNSMHEYPSDISSLSMIRSDEHHYWIGGDGLYQLNDLKTQNDLIVIPPGLSQLCSDLIISRSGNIYSLHDNGWLVAVDKNRKSFTHIEVPLHPQSTLTRLCEDHTGMLWIGSTQGIQLFDTVSKSFHVPSFLPASLMTENSNVLFSDSENKMWIGTRDPFHLYCYEPSTGITLEIPDAVLKQFSAFGKRGRISSITEDDDGRLWMVSMVGGGILCYDRKQNQWSSHPSGTRNINFLVDKGIVSFLPDKNGILWLSTVFGDGLVAYNYQRDSIIQYTREQGLLSDYVQTINSDNENNLWLTSEFGISQFSKNENHSVSNILLESDRSSNEVFETAFDSSSDQLILGMHDRYTFISTRSDMSTAPAPIPLLDKIEINNKEQFTDLDHPLLRLDHTQKNISIAFTAVHFTNADKLRFAYRLSGADDEWKFTTTNRNAQYAALSPGTYSFKLKVADESGNWGPEHEMLSFTIVPPFWKSAWFIICITGSALFISYWVVRKRIRTIRYEAGLKQKIAETEMMALRAQMNPHFIFNCINSIDSLIQDNDRYHATVYLNKFAKLIRCILDSSKQNTVTLANDMETLKLYIEMEQFRNENKFTADIKADPLLLQEDFKVPPLIIQPYVENAILHGLRNRAGNDGQLSISLKKLNGQIQYIIEDNGVGRSHVQNGHSDNKVSYGMQMSSDRVKLFNQEENASVEITDLVNKGISSGTRVEVLLKMI